MPSELSRIFYFAMHFTTLAVALQALQIKIVKPGEPLQKW